MRRTLSFAVGWIGLLLAAQVQSAATLKGEVRVNEVGGSLAPNIRVRANGANPVASDSEGQFILTFPDQQPGDATKVSIVREGWAVINDIELERDLPTNPEARRLTILISKASERQQWALQYYRLRGREVVEAEYQRKLQELQKAQAATAQERDRLQRERDQARAQVDELARQLAEAKPGEVGADVRRAQKLFVEGQIDQALQVLSEERLKQQAALAEEALAQAVKGYLLRGQLLAVKFQFDDAGKAYSEAARLAPNGFDAQFKYAYFHQYLNRLGAARQGYERALAIARELAKVNPETYRSDVALTLNNFGVLHRNQNRYPEARAAHEESLTIYRELAKVNPETYLPYVALALNNLANLHRAQSRYPEARAAYEESLTIYRELAKVNPETYRPDVARMLNNLGVLHRDQNRYPEARAAYEESLAILRELAKVNHETYRPDVARTLNNVGTLHNDQNRYPEARAAYEESLAIRRELAKVNPETYRPHVASTLNNLGVLHGAQNRYPEARAAYEESLAIYLEFAAQDSERFAPDVNRVRRLVGELPK